MGDNGDAHHYSIEESKLTAQVRDFAESADADMYDKPAVAE